MSIFTDIKNTALANGHKLILVEHILLTILNNDEAIEILKALDPSLDIDDAKRLIISQISEYPKQSNIKNVGSGTTALKIRELSERMSSDVEKMPVLDFLIVVFSVLRKEIEGGERALDSFEYLHVSDNEVKLGKMIRGEVVKLDAADDTPKGNREGNALFEEILGLPFDYSFIGKERELEELTNHIAGESAISVVVGDEGCGKTTLIKRAISSIKNGDGEPLMLANTSFLNCKLHKMASFELNARINLMIMNAIDDGSVLVMENIHKIQPFVDNSALISTLLAAAENGLKIVLSMTDSCYESTFGKINGLRSVAKVELRDYSLEELKQLAQLESESISASNDVSFEGVDDFAELVFEKTKAERLFNITASLSYARTNAIIEQRDTVSGENLRLALSRVTALDESRLSPKVEASLNEIERKISENIYGQDDAIAQIAEGARIASLGLKENENAPPAIFMMLGPTGVGKTETTYEFAKAIGKEVVRLDMSEYQESHTLSKLLGSPSGYIGFDKGDGALLDRLKKNPDAIVLFDEIEKAHPRIRQLMLGLMDYGTLTTSTNKVVDLSKNYIFFTSNVGIDTKDNGGFFGLAASANDQLASDKTVEFNDGKYESEFSPEFRARVDRKIKFQPLNRDVAKLVVEKSRRRFESKLLSKFSIEVDVSTAVVDHVIEKHFGVADGARKLKSGFEIEVISPVTEFIMKSQQSLSSKVSVNLVDGKIEVS